MRICESAIVQQVVGCTCDVCQKTFNKNVNDEEMLEVQEFVHISFTGGYGSIFGDMSEFELDICQHCLKEKLGQYIREVKNWLSPEGQAELAGGEVISAFEWGQQVGDQHDTLEDQPPRLIPTEVSRPFTEDDYLDAQSRNGAKRYGDD